MNSFDVLFDVSKSALLDWARLDCIAMAFLSLFFFFFFLLLLLLHLLGSLRLLYSYLTTLSHLYYIGIE